MSLKKEMKYWTQIGVAGFGLGLLGHLAKPAVQRVGEAAYDKMSMYQPAADIKGQLDENMAPEDRERLEQLLDIMNQTPHGRRLLRTLEKQQTKIYVEQSVGGALTAGMANSDDNTIKLKKAFLHLDNGPNNGLWILAHEATHIQNHVYFSKIPQTLDDAHYLNIIDEALAERGAFLVCKEAVRANLYGTQRSFQSDCFLHGYSVFDECDTIGRTGGKTVFDKRMLNYNDNQETYENQTKRMNNYYRTKKQEGIAPDDLLQNNPDWNDVVRQMSGGEVKTISQFPVPSFDLIHEMICQSYKDGNRSVDKVDLSCVEPYKNGLMEDSSFKVDIWRTMRKLVCEELQFNTPAATKMLSGLMPSDAKTFFWEYSRQKGDFLAQQSPQEYLNMALKVLNNPDLIKKANEDDASKAQLAKTEFVLKTYQHVFFGNAQGIPQNRNVAGR